MSTPSKKPHFVPGVGWRYDCDPERRALRNHPAHNYYGVGTYEITLVVENRRPVLGTLVGTTLGSGFRPTLEASPLGREVQKCLWTVTQQYPMTRVWACCLMPDHMHFILRVDSEMPQDRPLGSWVATFKSLCTHAYWNIDADAAAARQPLFAKGYCDRILMRDGQLEHWKAYLRDNPYRRMFVQEHPDIMQRVQCVILGGVRYGAFGNLFLLLHPERQQVFFHRKTVVDGRLLPTEETPLWQQERDRLAEAARMGDVLVTPGISRCEQLMKSLALEQGFRLIHLQKEPVGRYFKPERSRFEACCRGSLLVLAPWAEALQGYESDYGRFHRLNDLAAAICALTDAEAKAALANALVF